MVCHSPAACQSVEVALHRGAVWKLARQQTPGRGGPQQIEERLHHRAQRHAARPSEPFRRRQVRLNQRPFRVGHVTCVVQIFSPILPPSGFSPHVVPP
jgi:hypothetical protein